MNQRLEDLKSRGLRKLHDGSEKVQTSMRTSPMKWAGIAAGAGFGLGLIGRIAKARRKRMMPDLVIIEAAC